MAENPQRATPPAGSLFSVVRQSLVPLRDHEAIDALKAIESTVEQLQPSLLELTVLDNLNDAVRDRSEHWPGYQTLGAYIQRLREALK